MTGRTIAGPSRKLLRLLGLSLQYWSSRSKRLTSGAFWPIFLVAESPLRLARVKGEWAPSEPGSRMFLGHALVRERRPMALGLFE